MFSNAFQSQVSFLSGYYNDAEGTSIDTEFTTSNTWVDLAMGGDIVSDSNTIGKNRPRRVLCTYVYVFFVVPGAT